MSNKLKDILAYAILITVHFAVLTIVAIGFWRYGVQEYGSGIKGLCVLAGVFGFVGSFMWALDRLLE